MRSISVTAALCAATVLSACSGGGDADVTRSAPIAEVGAIAPRQPALDAAQADGGTSAIISDLIGRRSVLAPGPMSDIAGAVLAANSRASEAELRAAMLRSEARAQNWLPRLGPAVNLTSLGSIVTSLVLSQAIVDHGARQAERAFAQAEVEVAAIALAADSNARVHEALGLYLAAEAARSRAAVIEGARDRIDRYVWMIGERVAAGVSDRADLQLAEQRRDTLMAELAADRETAAVALAELQAMAASPVSDIRGLSGIAAPGPGARALTVMRAEAEGDRASAEARVTRAGYLPGLSMGGDLGGAGVGLTLGAANGLGLGQGAAMDAALVAAAAVEARVSREEEISAREIASMQGRLDSLIRQESEARRIAGQARDNFTLFAEQQAAGQRGIGEVMGVLETWIDAERDAVGLGYDIEAVRLAIAARIGVLVDGERM